jgi:cytoskeletal protein RodZ
LETLSCDVAGFSQASSDSLLDITLILCGVVVTVAACGVLVLLAVRRQSQRRDDLQAKVAARKAEQVALATEDKPEEDKPEEDKDTESDHAHSTSTEDGGSLAEVKADVNKDYVADQSDVDMAYAAEAKDLHNEAEVSGSDFLPNDPPSMVAEDGRWTLFEAENPNCTPGEMVGEMAL